jgi:hypothetical protein
MTLYKPKCRSNEQRFQPNFWTSSGSAFGIGICVAYFLLRKYMSDMIWVKRLGYIGLKIPSVQHT